MEKWVLPQTVEIGNEIYKINTDYRDILEIIEYLNSDEDEQTRALIVLSLFYDGFSQMDNANYEEALKYLMLFINCGEAIDDRPIPKMIDWEQDYSMIAPEINKIAGYEVRLASYLHWFTFIGYFHSIGDGQLAMIVSIRNKKRKGQRLEKWEREFYRDNKEKIDLKVKYTAEEQAEIDRLNRLMEGG